MNSRDPSSEPSPSGAARRRLIRGAFAVPVVATVHPGGALAASSSLRCLANGPTGSDAPDPLPVGATESPTYLRVELAVAGKNLGGESTPQYRHFVDGSSVYAAAATLNVNVASSLISSTGYRLFSLSTNSITGSEVSVVTGNGFDALTGDQLPNAQRYSVALIFDATGDTIVGVGQTGLDNTYASTHSCWTSFDTV